MWGIILMSFCCALLVASPATGQKAYQPYGKYYQYAHVPAHGQYEFGYHRGNDHHNVGRNEKFKDWAFQTQVTWHDKKGGYGRHYWDYNHMGKGKGQDLRSYYGKGYGDYSSQSPNTYAAGYVSAGYKVPSGGTGGIDHTGSYSSKEKGFYPPSSAATSEAAHSSEGPTSAEASGTTNSNGPKQQQTSAAYADPDYHYHDQHYHHHHHDDLGDYAHSGYDDFYHGHPVYRRVPAKKGKTSSRPTRKPKRMYYHY